MSGAWAREADTVILADWERLDRAALALTHALTGDAPRRTFWLRNASAIIRRERKALDPKGKCSRRHDWKGEFSDDGLIWGALRLLATVDCSYYVEHKVWHLRMAEAALRTLHKRGRA